MSRAIVLVLIAFGAGSSGVADEPPATSSPTPTTQWTTKSSMAEKRELPPAEKAALDAFRQALRDRNWDRAMAFCTTTTRAQALAYGSLQKYFEDCVPIEKLLAEITYQYCGGTSCGGKRRGFTGTAKAIREDFFLRLTEPSADESVTWPYSIEKTDGKWLIALPDSTVAEWTRQEVARHRREKAEAEAKWKALEPKLEGLRTQLAGLESEYRVGKPMRFRLELVNGGKHDLFYDPTQVAVNWSMTITYQDGTSVPYTTGPVQTLSAPKAIKAGTSAVLFESLDVAGDYDLSKLGKYRVQFNGGGLYVADNPEVFCGPERMRFPSNVVEIEVKP